MPQTATLVTTLIIERPLCLPCVTDKSGLTPAAVDRALELISRAVKVHHAQHVRCQGCGDVGHVVFLDRPAH